MISLRKEVFFVGKQAILAWGASVTSFKIGMIIEAQISQSEMGNKEFHLRCIAKDCTTQNIKTEEDMLGIIYSTFKRDELLRMIYYQMKKEDQENLNLGEKEKNGNNKTTNRNTESE